MEISLILVTCPDPKTAELISEALLEQKLAACTNIIPGMTSSYWWEGKIETAKEALMLIKTTEEQVELIEKVVKEKHPYDTPAFVVLDSSHVEEKYKNWLIESCRS